jgi:hypothetical protein
MLQSIENLAENPATNQKHLLRWFLFFLCTYEGSLSVDERSSMLCTYQDLADVIDGSKKEVSHV